MQLPGPRAHSLSLVPSHALLRHQALRTAGLRLPSSGRTPLLQPSSTWTQCQLGSGKWGHSVQCPRQPTLVCSTLARQARASGWQSSTHRSVAAGAMPPC